MTYAFLLLAALAVITWSVWGGASLPSVSIGSFDSMGIQERVNDIAREANDRVRASIRGAVRNQLHDAVDEALPEE